MTAGRRLWAGLRLLDRQLVTNDERFAGCVDDLELSASDDGSELYVTAILSGPGALAYRLRMRRFGSWLRLVHRHVATSDDDEDRDATRIAFNIVSDIGSHISLGCSCDDVGSESGERWAREHIVRHVPGSGHEPE